MRNYTVVNPTTLPLALEAIANAPVVALDTETYGSNPFNLYLPDFELVGVAIATSTTQGWYFPVGHKDFLLSYQPPNLSKEVVREVVLEALKRQVVYHNAAYDRRVLAVTLDIPLADTYGEDTMVALHLVDENHPLGLKEWAKTLLGLEEAEVDLEPPDLTDEDYQDAINKSGRRYKKKVRKLKPDWLERLKSAFAAMHNGGVSYRSLYKLISRAFQQLKNHGVITYAGSFPNDFRYFPVDIAAIYALDDAINTLALWQHVEVFFELYPTLYRLYREIELPVNDVMTRATHRGVLVDRSEIYRIKTTIQERIEEKQKEAQELLQALVGSRASEFSNPLNSPQQLSTILYELLGYPVVETTPNGAPSTSKTAIAKLLTLSPKDKKKAPLAKAFLEAKQAYEGLKKLLTTYTDSILEEVDPQGRLHTNFNTVGTVSGRMSSSNPNLQNLPRLLPEEVAEKPYLQGIDIRKAFIADPGYVFVSADYASMELVVCAAVSGDPTMRDLLNQGRDLHAYTARYAFKVGLDLDDKAFKERYKDYRQKAKVVNFALIYGGTEYTLVKNFGFSEEEASKLIQGYFEAYPRVKAWMDEVYQELEDKGYVEYPIYGYIKRMDLPKALRRMPKDKWPLVLNNDPEARKQYYASLRSCQNALIQGFSAFVVKEAIVQIQQALEAEGLDAQVIIQVHDEIVVLAREDQAQRVAEIMVEKMERSINGVQLKAEPEIKRTLSKVG
jgi:DNA polymerase I-like protein with 3'-5' exonuclease and polymerase domains